MKKKVLFVVSDFWPTRSGGTIRIEKLIKYLPEFDWEGVVVCRNLKGMAASETINGTRIYRSNSYDLAKIYAKIKNIFKNKQKTFNSNSNQALKAGTRMRLADFFFIPDVDILWAIGSLLTIQKAVKTEKIDIIYSTSPSASTHIATFLYKKLINRSITLIVEFRDPWTFNPFRSKKWFLLEKLDQLCEKWVVFNCDFISVTSKEYMSKFLQKYPKLSQEKIQYIPNGYDPEDFVALKPKKENTGLLKVIHTGNFYGKRSIKPFLEALYKIYIEFPQFKNRLLFVQYGVTDPEGIEFDLAYPNPMVDLRIPISHRESLQEMIDADWLLLVPGPGNGTMPGKVFEYLATGNPIIALVNEGPAKELIEKLNIGYVNNSEDINGIFNIILKILQGKGKFKRIDNSNSELQKFDRKNIAYQVSEKLNSFLQFKY